MATAPTFVSFTATSWTISGSTKTTASISVQSGDILVAITAVEGYNATQITGDPTVSGGSLTWTRRQLVQVTDYCQAAIWTATASSATSITVSGTKPSGDFSTTAFGFGVYVFRGSDGVGASNKTNVSSGAPSLSLTTTADNSVVIAIDGDWSAADGSSRTWRTINSVAPTSGNGYEKVYYRDSSLYTVYSAYWPDAGSAGSKTTGLSAPTGQKYAICALEVKGTASSGTDPIGTASNCLSMMSW